VNTDDDREKWIAREGGSVIWDFGKVTDRKNRKNEK
jgi:hypothetical protein